MKKQKELFEPPREKRMPNLYNCAILFTLISALGWGFEKLARYIVYHSTTDRGFLTLPLCPIYGSCILLIALLLGSPKAPSKGMDRLLRFLTPTEKTTSHILRYTIYFAGATLLSTLVELITGLIFLALGTPLWDYSQQHGNIAGVVCIEYSLLWGILITLFMATLWGMLCKLTEKISLKAQKKTALFLVIAMLIDFSFNCSYLLCTKSHFNFW